MARPLRVPRQGADDGASTRARWPSSGCRRELERYARAARPLSTPTPHQDIAPPQLRGRRPATPRTYTREKDTDNRSAWGTALVDIAEANPDLPIAVFDCDLDGVREDRGVREGAARRLRRVRRGRAQRRGGRRARCRRRPACSTFWADFGVFGIDEVYNQQRLNDINRASLKLVVTHCGLDVGEDGKTHQCLDYVGALRDFFGWKVDRARRPEPDRPRGALGRGAGGQRLRRDGPQQAPRRSSATDGEPFFGGDYEFRYGAVEWPREGEDVVILTMGTVAGACVDAADALAAEGFARRRRRRRVPARARALRDGARVRLRRCS